MRLWKGANCTLKGRFVTLTSKESASRFSIGAGVRHPIVFLRKIHRWIGTSHAINDRISPDHAPEELRAHMFDIRKTLHRDGTYEMIIGRRARRIKDLRGLHSNKGGVQLVGFIC